MTVCVAAICDSKTILGASDRMLTAGNVQFQPPSSKIYPITASIAIMVAGDMSLQAEIVSDLQGFIATQEQRNFAVKEIAESYVF